MGKGKKKGKRNGKKPQDRHPGPQGVPQNENEGEPGTSNSLTKEVEALPELQNQCENEENNDKVSCEPGAVADQKSSNETDNMKVGNDFDLTAHQPALDNLPPGDFSKMNALDKPKKEGLAQDKLKEEEKSSSEETSTAGTDGHGIQEGISITSPSTALTSTAAPTEATTVTRIDAANMQASQNNTGKSPLHPIGASMHPDGGSLRFSSDALRPGDESESSDSKKISIPRSTEASLCPDGGGLRPRSDALRAGGTSILRAFNKKMAQLPLSTPVKPLEPENSITKHETPVKIVGPREKPSNSTTFINMHPASSIPPTGDLASSVTRTVNPASSVTPAKDAHESNGTTKTPSPRLGDASPRPDDGIFCRSGDALRRGGTGIIGDSKEKKKQLPPSTPSRPQEPEKSITKNESPAGIPDGEEPSEKASSTSMTQATVDCASSINPAKDAYESSSTAKTPLTHLAGANPRPGGETLRSRSDTLCLDGTSTLGGAYTPNSSLPAPNKDITQQAKGHDHLGEKLRPRASKHVSFGLLPVLSAVKSSSSDERGDQGHKNIEKCSTDQGMQGKCSSSQASIGVRSGESSPAENVATEPEKISVSVTDKLGSAKPGLVETNSSPTFSLGNVLSAAPQVQGNISECDTEPTRKISLCSLTAGTKKKIGEAPHLDSTAFVPDSKSVDDPETAKVNPLKVSRGQECTKESIDGIVNSKARRISGSSAQLERDLPKSSSANKARAWGQVRKKTVQCPSGELEELSKALTDSEEEVIKVSHDAGNGKTEWHRPSNEGLLPSRRKDERTLLNGKKNGTELRSAHVAFTITSADCARNRGVPIPKVVRRNSMESAYSEEGESASIPASVYHQIRGTSRTSRQESNPNTSNGSPGQPRPINSAAKGKSFEVGTNEQQGTLTCKEEGNNPSLNRAGGGGKSCGYESLKEGTGIKLEGIERKTCKEENCSCVKSDETCLTHSCTLLRPSRRVIGEGLLRTTGSQLPSSVETNRKWNHNDGKDTLRNNCTKCTSRDGTTCCAIHYCTLFAMKKSDMRHTRRRRKRKNCSDGHRGKKELNCILDDNGCFGACCQVHVCHMFVPRD